MRRNPLSGVPPFFIAAAMSEKRVLCGSVRAAEGYSEAICSGQVLKKDGQDRIVRVRTGLTDAVFVKGQKDHGDSQIARFQEMPYGCRAQEEQDLPVNSALA